MNTHFIDPDHFLVSYWPGTEPDDNIITFRTESKIIVIKLKTSKPSLIIF